MGFQLQRLQERLKYVGTFAFNIIQLIAALLGIVTTAIGTAFVAWLLKQQSLIIPSLAFVLGASLTLLLVILLLLKTKTPSWLLRGYKYVKLEAIYEMHEDDPRHHTLTTIVEIEAIQTGISVFEDTYHWTGQGKEGKLKVHSSDHQLIGEIKQHGGWKYYYIHLGHELNIGERSEIKTTLDLYDTENKFEPFFERVVSQLIDHLTLCVILPKTKPSRSIVFSEWDTVGPASRLIKQFPGHINLYTGEIRWEIQSPVLGHRYQIKWDG
ncbi:MAG: hypothetical protein JOZ18_01575 [Chloroflexi bacterium]|nr:hypothetical protein [Chloroflexota bacterium]